MPPQLPLLGSHLPGRPRSPTLQEHLISTVWLGGVGSQKATHPRLKERSPAVLFYVPDTAADQERVRSYPLKPLLSLVWLPSLLVGFSWRPLSGYLPRAASVPQELSLRYLPCPQPPEGSSHTVPHSLASFSHKAGLSPLRGCQFHQGTCLFLSMAPSPMPGKGSRFAKWKVRNCHRNPECKWKISLKYSRQQIHV